MSSPVSRLAPDASWRWCSQSRGLQQIVSTLAASVPAIVNLLVLLLLSFFVFAVLGVALFSDVCTETDLALPDRQAVRCLMVADTGILNGHAHMRNVGYAALTLFRVATNDNWSELLVACSIAPGPRSITPALREAVDALLPPGALDLDQSEAPLRLAVAALERWLALGTADGSLQDASPQGAKRGAWLALARHALPGCLSQDEALALQAQGVLECRKPDGTLVPCSASCGLPVVADIFFLSFVCVAAFVLLQLVIAVLMEQLEENDEACRPLLLHTRDFCCPHLACVSESRMTPAERPPQCSRQWLRQTRTPQISAHVCIPPLQPAQSVGGPYAWDMQ